jgi:hypothetical protein
MTSSIESNNRPDEEISNLSWNNHLLRNQSIIVDGKQKTEQKHQKSAATKHPDKLKIFEAQCIFVYFYFIIFFILFSIL